MDRPDDMHTTGDALGVHAEALAKALAGMVCPCLHGDATLGMRGHESAHVLSCAIRNTVACGACRALVAYRARMTDAGSDVSSSS